MIALDTKGDSVVITVAPGGARLTEGEGWALSLRLKQALLKIQRDRILKHDRL
jgi:hypothetical protein